MIKIKQIHIEEFRGIRKLTLDLDGKSFGICGSNGTGKSGVVDAIEFGLTGSLTRLTGEGQGELSVSRHAPHVDLRAEPEKSKVTITAHISEQVGKGCPCRDGLGFRAECRDNTVGGVFAQFGDKRRWSCI